MPDIKFRNVLIVYRAIAANNVKLVPVHHKLNVGLIDGLIWATLIMQFVLLICVMVKIL